MTESVDLQHDVPSNDNLQRGYAMSGIGTWELDLATRQLTWSGITRALFGISASEPVSFALFLSLLEPQDKERTELAVQLCLETGCRFDIEYRIARPQGGHQWVRAKGGIIVGNDGAPSHFSGVMLDIDDQKRTEEALRLREAHLRVNAPEKNG